RVVVRDRDRPDGDGGARVAAGVGGRRHHRVGAATHLAAIALGPDAEALAVRGDLAVIGRVAVALPFVGLIRGTADELPRDGQAAIVGDDRVEVDFSEAHHLMIRGPQAPAPTTGRHHHGRGRVHHVERLYPTAAVIAPIR